MRHMARLESVNYISYMLLCLMDSFQVVGENYGSSDSLSNTIQHTYCLFILGVAERLLGNYCIGTQVGVFGVIGVVIIWERSVCQPS
jgi:hypothetical protein